MKKSILATLPVAAFVAGLAVVPSVFADTENAIGTWADLKTCLEGSSATCTLGTFSGNTGDPIEVNGTKTLDLNRQTITAVQGGALFDLRENDKLTITNGTMMATESGAGIRLWGGTAENAAAGSTNLTIKDDAIIQDINLAFWNTSDHNYGSQLDVYGQVNNTGIGNNVIYIIGNIKDAKNAPVINIHDGASVESVKGDKIPFYLAGYGTTTIGRATVKGASGVAIKAGVLNLNGATIEATGAYSEGKVNSNGVDPTGAGIQIEAYDPPYEGKITLNITDSTVTSSYGDAIQEYGDGTTQTLEAINLKGDVTLTPAAGRKALAIEESVGDDANNFKVTINGAEVPNTTLTEAEGTFTTVEAPVAPEENPENPNTADAIATYITIAAVALVGLGATAFIAKKSRR